MKTSIIINTYNRPDFLRKSLISLCHQSVTIEELIIADDGSSEDMLSILNEFKPQLSCPVKYVTQADKGFRLARCRNNGVRYASGDFLIFLDQDLVYTRHFLKTMIDHAKKGYFVVAWPVRTTQAQAILMDETLISHGEYESVITQQQCKRVKKQFKKDLFKRLCHFLHLKKSGTKFRGGVAGIFREDYIRINGYDENYIGWGNEDDDFGRRLYFSGIKGINPFYNDYPVHLWHPENHNAGERINLKYHQEKSKNLGKKLFRCTFGYDNSLGDDQASVIILP
ncbi:MAG: glycosyltransferase [Candidatus Cloacimonetes bacterium]|nr:glycosyltransferase [Candidatus Cloacimonadota bacterium]